MSDKRMRDERQSGAIGVWLLLTTATITLVLVSSWMRQGAPRASHGNVSALSDAQTEVPAKELKLLAAEVVSRAIMPDSYSIDDADNPKAAHSGHTHEEIQPDVPEVESASEDNTDSVNHELIPHEIHEQVLIVSDKLQFPEASKQITEQMKPVLGRLVDTLSAHDDVHIVVAVATGDSGDEKQDLRLSQERGRAIIARLVSGGIDFLRISLDASSGAGVTGGSHRVEIRAWKASEPRDG